MMTAPKIRALARFTRLIRIVALSLLSCCASTNAKGQDGWGHLKGRIVYGGDVPEVVTLDIERDAEVCGKHGLTDESLVVNKDNRGIRYVAIWLESKEPVPVHPDLQTLPDKPPVLDNKNCRFEPHMQALRTNQLIHFTNSDSVAHNAAVYVRRTTPFSEVIPQNQPLEKKFAKAETLPTRVDCSIHAWMKAWLIITDHPYVAITNESGEFELKNIPAGDWKFRFWHERPGYLPSATCDGQPVELTKGSWTLSIKPDEPINLGDLTIDAAVFAKKK
jgi:hypothetical protein